MHSTAKLRWFFSNSENLTWLCFDRVCRSIGGRWHWNRGSLWTAPNLKFYALNLGVVTRFFSCGENLAFSKELTDQVACNPHNSEAKAHVQVSVSCSFFHSCKPSFVRSSFRAPGSNFLKTISLALSPVGERLWGSKSVDAEEDKDAVWVANAANDCVELRYLCEDDYSMYKGDHFTESSQPAYGVRA